MSSDPFRLQRFVQAQAGHDPRGDSYAEALAEMRRGSKQRHWMWYVFPIPYKPQSSPISKQFAIRSLAEARAYLLHPVLGTRLAEITAVVYDQLCLRGGNVAHLMNQALQRRTAQRYAHDELVDVRKLLKCMVLFGHEARTLPAQEHAWLADFVIQTHAIHQHILAQGYASDISVRAQIATWERER